MTIIVDMATNKVSRKTKMKQIVDLLKFVLTLDDEELIKSTIESVIESLEDISNK